MQDSVDISPQVDRQNLADALTTQLISIRDGWRQMIAEQSPFPGDIPPDLLDTYLVTLASYIVEPDASIVANLSAIWCEQVSPSTQGVAATAVAMGLLGEAFRSVLRGHEDGAFPDAALGLACSILPDFSAEFVRGLMRGSDLTPAGQHWYEVSQQLEKDRERKLTELAILNEVSNALASTLSLDELYGIIYEQCGRLVDTDYFYIATLGPSPDELTVQLQYFEGQRAPNLEHRSVRRALTRDVVDSGKPLNVDDYVAACRERGIEPGLPGVILPARLAWLGVPIIAGNTPLGVLVIMSRHGSFDEADIEILAAVARQAGAAIQKAQLYEAQLNQANQLRALNQLSRAMTSIREPDPLMQVACDLIRELFGYSIVSVHLAHPGNDHLVLRKEAGLEGGDDLIGMTLTIGGPGLIAHAAASRRPVLANDVLHDARFLQSPQIQAVRSELSVPLLRDGRLLGVLDVQSPAVNAFSEQDVDLLVTVADQLAIALENADLLVQERKRRAELTRILEVSHAANSSLVLDDVIQRVAEGMSDALGLPSCVVYLYDEEADRLLPSAFVAGEGSEIDTTRVTQVVPTLESSRLLQRIFLAGHDASAIEMMTCDVDDELARVLCATAVLSVPFVVKQQLLGFALIAAHDAAYHFTPHQLRVACGIAGAATLALENARLYARSHTLGRAEERIRVAREIHDGIAQGLTAISLNLEAAEQMLERKPEKALAKIGRALELTRSKLEDARRSVLDLHSSALEELTLTEAISHRTHQFLAELRDRDMTGTFDGEDMYGRLSSRMELNLYRIFEEALDNIARHASATHVDVSLHRRGDDVVLSVHDNGCGFDVEKILSGQGAPGGFGLVAIRERVRLSQGSLEVRSTPDAGTLITVTVPFESQHDGSQRGMETAGVA